VTEAAGLPSGEAGVVRAVRVAVLTATGALAVTVVLVPQVVRLLVTLGSILSWSRA
jgi:hypothetical protein